MDFEKHLPEPVPAVNTFCWKTALSDFGEAKGNAAGLRITWTIFLNSW